MLKYSALIALPFLIFLLSCSSMSKEVTKTATASEKGSPYKQDAGPWAVRILDLTWHDDARHRDVPVRIHAPDPQYAKGTLPVIVISPGFGGSREGYSYLAGHLASHGYLCVTLTHIGTDTATFREGGLKGLAKALKDPKNLVLRPQDVIFAIDQIVSREQGEELIKGRVDAKRIAVAGHSFGAYTALALAGQVVDTGEGQLRTFKDDRVKAVLAMSPQAPGSFGLNSASWNDIRTPAMTMTGTADANLFTRRVEDRRFAFDHMPAGDKYHVTIRDADHFTFADGGINLLRPKVPAGRDERHHEWIKQLSVSFFDAYLMKDGNAKDWLKNLEVTRYTNGECKLEAK